MFLCAECLVCVFVFKQKAAYEMRISDWSSDVCSSDLVDQAAFGVVEPVDMSPHLTDDRLQHGNAIEPIIFVALGLVSVNHREGIETEARAHRELDECAALKFAAMLEAAAVIDHDDLSAGADERRGHFLQRCRCEMGKASCRGRVCQ